MSKGILSKRVEYEGSWSGSGFLSSNLAVTVGSGNNSQALAVQLTKEVNVVTTSSATASTGVKLVAGCVPGDELVLFNNTANGVAVYPQVGGQIDALGANAAFTLAAGKKVKFESLGGENWLALLSA